MAFTTRLPPHIDRELETLLAPYKRHMKAKVSKTDMVGALILRARRDHYGLMEDLAAYLDVRDAYDSEKIERLPDL